MNHAALPCVLALSTALWGCASAPPPTGQMEAAAAAIRAAQEVGAQRVPQAALHLQLATEQSAAARDLIGKEEQSRAAYVLMRAEADAELAVALARSEAARQKAKEAQERLRAPVDGAPPSP